MDQKNLYKRDDTGGEGTSLWDVEVEASLEQLIALFGEPTDGDGGYKTLHGWGFRGPNGVSVTLYDYKYDGAREKHWHVGGKDATDCIRFAAWVRAQF